MWAFRRSCPARRSTCGRRTIWIVPRPGHSGQDHQAEPPPRQRGGVAQAGGGGRAAGPQERGAAASGRRRGGHRHRQESDRVRRVRRSGRHRRIAARQRHVVWPRDASIGSGARRRRDHRQGAEVRSRQGTHFAGTAADGAGSVGDLAGALSQRIARDRPGDERHRLRRVRRNRARRRGSDPHLRDDLEPADEASEQGGEGGRPGGSGGARSEAARTAAFRWASSNWKPIPGPPWRSATASARWWKAGCAS